MIDQLTEREYAYVVKHDLMTFIERSFRELNPNTSFEANWHIDIIAAKLEECRRGKVRRLIVNLPPRSLKSTRLPWPLEPGFSHTHPRRGSSVPATDRTSQRSMRATVAS
jgi:hypothetical protein